MQEIKIIVVLVVMRGIYSNPGRDAHFLFRPSRPTIGMFGPCLILTKVRDRAWPKQDMFRPCSTKKNCARQCSAQARYESTVLDQKKALDRARSKQEMFSTVIDWRNVCFDRARLCLTVLDRARGKIRHCDRPKYTSQLSFFGRALTCAWLRKSKHKVSISSWVLANSWNRPN